MRSESTWVRALAFTALWVAGLALAPAAAHSSPARSCQDVLVSVSSSQIAPSFPAVRFHMRDALFAGKKLLIFNQSSERAPLGREVVQASLYNFLIQQNLKRSEVYLVIFADADSFSSRAELLAVLGADLLALKPSPVEFFDIAQQDWFFRFLNRVKVTEWAAKKEQILAQESLTAEQVAEVDLVFQVAARMFTTFREGRGHEVIQHFEATSSEHALSLWHPSSWQMLLEFSLDLDDFAPGSVHKMLPESGNSPDLTEVIWSRAAGQVVNFIEGNDARP